VLSLSEKSEVPGLQRGLDSNASHNTSWIEKGLLTLGDLGMQSDSKNNEKFAGSN
jgi:hypothetical protein